MEEGHISITFYQVAFREISTDCAHKSAAMNGGNPQVSQGSPLGQTLLSALRTD